MKQKPEASQAVDAPMPSGVENMTKQELWNWFQCYARAIAVKSAEEKRFFRLTTGLHDARMMTSPLEIIEAQRKRMAGLELQMAQMQKGYDKKLKKALKAQPAPTEAAQPDRHALQAEGKHPAPCARHCEATAFGIEIRRLGAENERLRAAQGEDSARLELMQYTAAPGVEIAGIAALLANAREMAARAYRPKPNWVVACSLFDVRPQESIEICSIAGIDPYALKIDRARASAETGGVKP